MEVTPGGGWREHDALDRPGRLASSLLRSFSVTSTPLRMHLVPPLLITSMSRIGSGHYKGRRARSESQHRSWPYGITGQICLVHEVVTAMGDGPARVLNIGAGHSPWVERQIGVRHRDFVSDRVDIDSPTVAEEHLSIAHVGRCWTAPIEEMSETPSDSYGVAFACYVLEHVHDLEAAAREVHRVLRPEGIFVMAVPNPRALQMRIAAITPLWFHRLVKGVEGYPTVYAYRTLDELAAIFERRGFQWLTVYRIANLGGYLNRWPPVRGIGRFCDWIVLRLGLTALMGDACLVCQAPSERDPDGGARTTGPGDRHPLRDQRFTWGPPRRPPWPVG